MNSENISKKILHWYDNNKRFLPWRKKVSKKQKEYFTLVSEFMLQQTQVVTVIPYFNRFIKNIPDLETLASFENRKLIKLWEGLGYYSRVRNLKKAAQMVIKDFNKTLPDNIIDLKSLPGIGDYTASAISSICFEKKHPVLDGNVFRIISRIFGIKDPIDLNDSRKVFKKKATDLLLEDKISKVLI